MLRGPESASDLITTLWDTEISPDAFDNTLCKHVNGSFGPKASKYFLDKYYILALRELHVPYQSYFTSFEIPTRAGSRGRFALLPM